MDVTRYVYWEDDGLYVGYLEEFPDYMTQGVSLEELAENLRDIFADLTSGHIPAVRRVAELNIS
ncbi:MAG: type II toxin-antitoxin system HicB family antitoxin [Candidatus Hydrogenedentes bacterium]|nr:type II toxin-antitoxin system HicB family antitoxin [Candidatus Hydrogenedentota bacterium]